MRYVDLTSSELSYLHGKGSDEAGTALLERARKGDAEALEYLTPDMMGAEAPPLAASDILMPHKLIDRALAANVNPNTMRLRGPVRPGIRPGIRPGTRAPVRVRPPVGPKLPKWGVFVDYEQQPMEVFDTLAQANAWAATVPPDIFFAVIRAGQEPPRPPFGWTASNVETPLTYEQTEQQASPTGRAPSGYEAFQLAQGQRI